tara:strand:- start:1567 stop:1758 length:192 start_codon:yes stop_codon:yes gene_type:complete
MGYELKTFKVNTTINQRFKEECVKAGVQQGFVLENLMSRFIKLKTLEGKREVKIYDYGKQKNT